MGRAWKDRDGRRVFQSEGQPLVKILGLQRLDDILGIIKCFICLEPDIGESCCRIRIKQVVEESTWHVSKFRLSEVAQHAG